MSYSRLSIEKPAELAAVASVGALPAAVRPAVKTWKGSPSRIEEKGK
jgi:hypothetical protein